MALFIFLLPMKVTIKYNDNYSLTQDEVISNGKSIFGDNAEIIIEPTNDSAESIIYHGIQKLITTEQVQLFFDKGEYVYQEEIIKLKKETLTKLETILVQVLIDNESRIT